jgi:hypothetical protein
MQSFDLPTSVDSHSWTWLLDVSRHLNVAIEIVDERCVPMLPAGTSETATALRGLLTTQDSALRSTLSTVTPSSPQAVAIDNRLFVCCGLSGAGTLIVAREMKTGGAAADEIRLEVEAIANWTSGAIEQSSSRGSIDATVDSHMVASLRRLLDEAVARGSVRGVVSAFVESVAVWLEIEVHGYVADARGKFVHSVSPVGTDHTAVPAELDDDVIPMDAVMVRRFSPDTERFEFGSMPGAVLIRRIATRGGAWVMVFAGKIDRRDEARLTVVSDLFRGALNALMSETVEALAPAAATSTEEASSAAAAQPDRSERRRAHRPFPAWIERLASQAIQEGGQASVIVISIPDEDVRPEFVQAQVVKIRNELRPSDFAGSLAPGEIGVLLRDTPGDRAAAVSARLEKLLQWDVNTGKAIQPSVGVVSCSAESPIEGSLLHAARQKCAARAQR